MNIIDNKIKRIQSLMEIADYYNVFKNKKDMADKVNTVMDKLVNEVLENINGIINKKEEGGRHQNTSSKNERFYSAPSDEELEDEIMDKAADDIMNYVFGDNWNDTYHIKKKYNNTDFDGDVLSDFMHAVNKFGHH